MRSQSLRLLFVALAVMVGASCLVSFSNRAVRAAELRQVKVVQVTASSDATEGTEWPHHPAMAVDGDPSTSWAASSNDTVGAWLKFNFGVRTKIDQIRIVNGWIPKGYPDFFTHNHRAKRITLIDDNGKQQSFELQDTNSVQSVSLTLGDTESLTLRIDEIYSAANGAEEPWLTISEVVFFTGSPLK